jgi:hypothetical protein
MTTPTKVRSNGFRRKHDYLVVDDQVSLRRGFRRAVLTDHLTVTTIRTAKRLTASETGFTGGHLPADATAVINVTRAIVAALETVENIRDHLGADS